MKFKWFIALVGVLALGVLPALAQDAGANSVTFNGVSFQFDSSLATNVNIRQAPGEPSNVEQPGGPQVAHTAFTLFNGMETPPDWYAGAGELYFYRTADFAGYELATGELQHLQSLLADRPDLGQFLVAREDNSADLPYMPVSPGAQVLRGQAHYIDTPALSGVAYLTAFRQDVSPFVASEFLYTFQGLSNDGATYIAALFRVNVPTFPAHVDMDLDQLANNYMEYLTDSIAVLNETAPTEVKPNLNTIDAMLQSITFSGTADVQPTPGGDVATEAPPAGQEGSAGALEGTWRLVSYGDPADPTPVIEGSKVTAIFEPGGIGGDAGCNTYGGSFQFEGQMLTISNVISTLRACAEEGVMEQETAYLNALNQVTAYQIEGTTLQLLYPEGVLVFEAM